MVNQIRHLEVECYHSLGSNFTKSRRFIGLSRLKLTSGDKMENKKVYLDFETKQNIKLIDQMVFINGKNGKNYVAECKEIYQSIVNKKWYYVFEKI